jgi:CRISPR/Cas system CSM-associated protein Csm3 (group 7 of RAMP superfamily)
MRTLEGGMIIKEGGIVMIKHEGRAYPLAKGWTINPDYIGISPIEFDLAPGRPTETVVYINLEDDDGETQILKAPAPKATSQTSNTAQKKDEEKWEAINKKRFENPGKAPYNFVPLNAQVVTVSDVSDTTYSGYLDCTIIAETAFFIRKDKDERQFFKMGDTTMVPGSSLRGLMRSMVEMLAYSRLSDTYYSDKTYSFRSLADMCPPLRDAYQIALPSDREDKDYLGGYLYFDTGQDCYYIVPAESVTKVLSEEKGPSSPVFHQKGCNVFSGHIPKKKHQWALGKAKPGERKCVHDTAIRAYEADKTRSSKFNVLDACKKLEYKTSGYPVFYLLDLHGKMVDSFGHTPFYRLPYRLSIKDHVIAGQPITQEKGEMDFATALFGTTEQAGRVWFCDAAQEAGTALPSRHTHKLMTPKPTSFQHYLLQPTGYRTDIRQLRHWNDADAPIRGYKLYWHRITADKVAQSEADIPSWASDAASVTKQDNTYQHPICALPAGSRFRGRIHFDHLSAAELGALLFALNLPGECRHKLGLGKPLGLGSVHIQAELTLIDRPKRYAQLWGEDGQWRLGTEPHALEAPFRAAFVEAMGLGLGKAITDENQLWQEPRLRALRTVLAWNPEQQRSKGWLEATRYMRNGAGETGDQGKPEKGDMAPNEYRDRPVLPTPEEVVDRFKKSPQPPH